MTKIAVVLSGCGYLDGAEIREAVIALLELDKAGANVQCFAPDITQMHVINHLTGKEAASERRNVLVESARIARGEIKNLKDMRIDDFDGLILPGGFGVANNLSDLAVRGKNATVLPQFKKLLLGFTRAQKPIGAICISPAVLVAAVSSEIKPTVTIGEDNDKLIESLGGIHINRPASDFYFDKENNIASCPAYMEDAPLSEIAQGIAKVVAKVMEQAGAGQMQQARRA
jgi:enhancing lycopene biosynthesis protein 2